MRTDNFKKDLDLALKCFEGKKYVDAIVLYNKIQEAGGNIPYTMLAWSYEELADYKNAFKYYLIAAEEGNVVAQYRLGGYYYNGKGCVQDCLEAEKWYKKAAEQGDMVAQNEYGCFLSQVERKEEAVECFKKSAEQGYDEAQYNLGSSYYWGDGIEQDYSAAFLWYKKAAEQDHEDF